LVELLRLVLQVKRRLSNLIATLSLLLFLATCALWLRSYFILDRWDRVFVGPVGGELTEIRVATSRGLVEIFRTAGVAVDPSVMPDVPAAHYAVPGGHLMLGGHWRWYTSSSADGFVSDYMVRKQRTQIVKFPLWIVVIAFALLPAWRELILWRQRRLRMQGRCVNCGYDLRASSGRCPECGVEQRSEVRDQKSARTA
jgi:hypothetical protein